MNLTFEKFKEIAVKVFFEQFNDDPKHITKESDLLNKNLQNDLGFDSLTHIEFYFALEDELNFQFSEDIDEIEFESFTFERYIQYLYDNEITDQDKEIWKEKETIT